MKKPTPTNRPLTRKVLDLISESYLEWNDQVRLPGFLRYTVLFPEIIEREMTEARRNRRLRETVRKLRRNQLVEIRKIGLKMALCLTDKGKGLVLLDAIKNGKPRTDGRLLLVSFDIPERERNLRDRFSRVLKTAGLRRLHKSLWVTDKDVADSLNKYLDRLGAKTWIRLFEARAIPPPRH